MNLIGLGPGGKLGDEVELAKQLAHHLARIVALTERVEVGEHELERVFGLRNGDVGVVLALPFETPMMFEKLFAEELGETLTGRPAERPG